MSGALTENWLKGAPPTVSQPKSRPTALLATPGEWISVNEWNYGISARKRKFCVFAVDPCFFAKVGENRDFGFRGVPGRSGSSGDFPSFSTKNTLEVPGGSGGFFFRSEFFFPPNLHKKTHFAEIHRRGPPLRIFFAQETSFVSKCRKSQHSDKTSQTHAEPPNCPKLSGICPEHQLGRKPALLPWKCVCGPISCFVFLSKVGFCFS